MLDNHVKVLTAKGGVQQIPLDMHDYICLTSDKKLYYNKEYANHPQVLNKIAYFVVIYNNFYYCNCNKGRK